MGNWKGILRFAVCAIMFIALMLYLAPKAC